jgi:hypothetical protein
MAHLHPFLKGKEFNDNVPTVFRWTARIGHHKGSGIVLVDDSRVGLGYTQLNEDGTKIFGGLSSTDISNVFILGGASANGDNPLSAVINGSPIECEDVGTHRAPSLQKVSIGDINISCQSVIPRSVGKCGVKCAKGTMGNGYVGEVQARVGSPKHNAILLGLTEVVEHPTVA